MFYIQALFAMVLVLSSGTVYAVDSCSTVFVPEAVRINDFPPVSQLSLPKTFLEILSRHPLVGKMRAIYGSGQDLEVVMPYLQPEFEKTGKISSLVGEAIQSRFIEQLLKVIFPDILITSGNKPSSLRKHLELFVSDSAERGFDAAVKRPTMLEMAKVKLANPGHRRFSKAQLRKAFGLPPLGRIVSVNVTVSATLSEILKIFEQVRKLEPDLIIFSSAMHFGDKTRELMGMTIDNQLTRLAHIDLSNRPIVYNDTVGKMYAIYGAADLSIMFGAINIGEPLIAGTPTIFSSSQSNSLYNYHRSTYSRLERTAVATGGGFSVEKIQDIVPIAKEILKNPKPLPITSPYMVELDGRSALDDLLEEIQYQLGIQLADKNTQ
jgi:hypothetical protein